MSIKSIKIVILIFVCLFLITACSTSTDNLRIKNDIDYIHQQIYELKKEQLRNTNQIDEIKKIITSGETSQSINEDWDETKPVTPQAESTEGMSHSVENPLRPKTDIISGKDLYDQGYELFNSGEYLKASSAFQTYADKFPETELTDNAWYWIGECMYSLENYPDAVKAFDFVIQNFPKGNKLAASHLKKGFCYLKMNMTQIALSTFRNVKQSFPDTEAAKIADMKLRELSR